MLIDCVTFYNELDILEIRLRELYDAVDRFILVEAMHTHKGDEKPLYYATNRQRFARWNDKIDHIVVGDLPAGDTQAAIWRREIGQRQAIERGLIDVPDDAIVLISDLDEIPRMEAVRALQGGIPDDAVIVFDQTLYYYNVNTSCVNLRWSGTRATTAGNARALTPDGVRWSGLRSHEYPRHFRLTGDHPAIGMPGRSAGWHLSYFGDVAHVQAKMRAFLHQELVSDETLDPDTIAHRMAEGLDIWGRESEQRFEIGPAPDLPRAIRSDPVRWSSYFHPDWRSTFHEDWYPGEQALVVGDWARAAPEGAIVEIGCWEGRSAVCIAQAIAPRTLLCIDHWQGNGEEERAKQEAHPSVRAADERDVLGTFVCNMERLAPENWQHEVKDWHAWVDAFYDRPREFELRIAFLHLDASHDYQSVFDCLTAIKPFLVEHAIVCGDDLYADGVYRGVHDALGESVQEVGGRLWVWQKSA